MLGRRPARAKNKVNVTFQLPAAAGASEAWVAGEWNEWSQDEHPMKRKRDGSFECTLPLEKGRSYRFRYYLGGDRWENDWDADAYVDNEFGGADSVVDLTD